MGKPLPVIRLEEMSQAHAAAILGAAQSGESKRELRKLTRALGYGGGSDDLTRAIARAKEVTQTSDNV